MPLGLQYKGSRISRDELLQSPSDDDVLDSGISEDVSPAEDLPGQYGDSIEQREDEDGESGSDEIEAEYSKDSSLVANDANDAGVESTDDDDLESSEDKLAMGDTYGIRDTSTDASTDAEPPDGPLHTLSNDRTALREMMAESQKSVLAAISAATQADITKGKAIQRQRSAFDALLNTRIRLQKSLVAANSFPHPFTSLPDSATSPESAIRAAESAALTLWNRLDTLRHSLDPSSSSNLHKRPFSATLAMPTSSFWTHMQTHESISLPRRRAVLSKWSTKLHPPSALRSTLSAASKTTPLPTILDQHLSPQNTTRLIARTRVPRSFPAPQAFSGQSSQSTNIYDDADLYALLLRDLVQRRMGDAASVPEDSAAAWPAMNVVKRPKRTVNTKASKGRRMRYAVHEKLRDFMVREDRGRWSDRQVDELFGTLLGRKRSAILEEVDEHGEEVDGDGEEETLMLFRR